jgi:hypothetical protein
MKKGKNEEGILDEAAYRTSLEREVKKYTHSTNITNSCHYQMAQRYEALDYYFGSLGSLIGTTSGIAAAFASFFGTSGFELKDDFVKVIANLENFTWLHLWVLPLIIFAMMAYCCKLISSYQNWPDKARQHRKTACDYNILYRKGKQFRYDLLNSPFLTNDKVPELWKELQDQRDTCERDAIDTGVISSSVHQHIKAKIDEKKKKERADADKQKKLA